MAPEMHRIALKKPKKALAHPFGTQKRVANECAPERLSTAISPIKKQFRNARRRFGTANKKYSFRSLCPKCNDDDRRQRRKQGGVVGAAASKTRVPPKARCGCWVPQPDSGGHSKSFYLPASSTASTAFWTWRRFSASSKISSACCSNRAVEISSPRWAGRQCSTSASGLAFSSRRPVS